MISSALPLSLLLLVGRSIAASVPFIDDTSLGETYPYTVHLPAGDNPPSTPPILVFLHGMGSRGDASMMDTLVTWNGVGTLLADYYSGNTSEAQTLAAEEFLTVMPLAPAGTETTNTDWDDNGVMAVLEKVKSDYAGKYDPQRVYLTGYSMGARAVWWLLLSNSSSFSCGAASAGEVLAPFPNFGAMLSTPMRHYIGTEDYDGSSTVAEANALQAAVEATPGYMGNLELVLVPGPDPPPAHNAMSIAPFTSDMLNWLLNHTSIPSAGNVATSSNGTSTSSSSSSSSSATGGGNSTTTAPQSSGALLAGPAETALLALAAWTIMGSIA